MKKITILILIAVSLFISCSRSSRRMVTLWTNRPEIAAYVEEFNATNDTVKIEIEYRDSPGTELVSAQTPVDLVFDEYLNSSQTAPLFGSLDSLFKNQSIDPSLFYEDLLDLGTLEEHTIFLPVSFNLPLIYFKKRLESEYIEPFFMNVDNLKKASSLINRSSTKSFTREGFSPLWSKESIYQMAVLNNTDFKQLGNILSWNDENLEKTVSSIKDWIKTVNKGMDAEREFEEKFLYDPRPKLVNQGRIAFAYSDINSFFTLPPEKRENLDFRWLSSGDKVYALNSILFAGIPKNAEHKKEAGVFLSWFFKTETQEKLLEASMHKRIRIFGIGQGFSSLKTVNNTVLPKLYPALMGHIPPENAIVYPFPVPANWPVIKDQIIKPWLLEKITAEDPQNRELKDAVTNWERQNPEQSKVID